MCMCLLGLRARKKSTAQVIMVNQLYWNFHYALKSFWQFKNDFQRNLMIQTASLHDKQDHLEENICKKDKLV